MEVRDLATNKRSAELYAELASYFKANVLPTPHLPIEANDQEDSHGFNFL
jgi:hypothetical protein